MSAIDELAKLKKRVESAEKEKERAVGARDQIMLRLEKEFGCKTIIEAEKKLQTLTRKSVEAKTEFESSLARFQGEFKSELG